ncbi:MAG TPA: alpha-glucuronidase, partial [Phycisphaerae bacterium]|nr:alpha-glucuronidase [Phycisphaerae bacterium]
LGLHHLIGGDHYAPMPWNDTAPRRDWTAVYYHQASKEGIGFDRTRGGDKAVDQYFPPVADTFNDVARCPEKFLLWFHRLPWDHKMSSGKTLWQELCRRYHDGAQAAGQQILDWDMTDTIAGIDPGRFQAVRARLQIQARDANLWRDQILTYFQKFSGMPIDPPAPRAAP